ncbi:hypothetical protein NKH70_17335 [Mesorhizobium sp. M0991]|uniref:hypothetical protein n=1 Tax=Mesorhizobium sp. M0991 TaxID=2957043 RepID=UPI0033379DC0
MPRSKRLDASGARSAIRPSQQDRGEEIISIAIASICCSAGPCQPRIPEQGCDFAVEPETGSDRMSELPNEEIEGRLNAQRETLALVVALLASKDTAPERIWAELEARFQFPNSQEDPGVLPSSAFAIEAAKMREFKLIADEARARNAEWNSRDEPQGASRNPGEWMQDRLFYGD